MKKHLISFLKIALPIGLGIYLIYFIYHQLTEQEKTDLFIAVKNANYFYVFLSLIMGILSHYLRAYRWNFMLEPLGYKPKVINNFFAVMIGYVMNLAFPRLGEASRCASIAKYEKIPFQNAFGTVMAERVLDLMALILITIITIFLQFEVLQEKAGELLEGFQKMITPGKIAALFLLALGGLGLFIWVSRKFIHVPLVAKTVAFLLGIKDGLISVFTMKKKWSYLFFTLLIWALYVAGAWICFFAIESTSSVGIGGIMAAFIFGSFAIVLVQGGIGVYPVAIMQVLFLYGVGKSDGFALGWIIWTSQTALIILVGLFSLFYIPFYNKGYEPILIDIKE